MISYNNVLIGFIERFSIDLNSIDELCYKFYSSFKDSAVSIAIERPSCARIVIVGKDFEIRVYMSPTGEGTLSTFISVKQDVYNIIENLKKFLMPINKTVSSLANIMDEPIILLRIILTPSSKTINHILQLFKNMGIVIEVIDRRLINDFNVTIVKGFYIGKNLRKYQVTLSIITNSRVEVGVTVEAKMHIEMLYRDNLLFDFIKDLYSLLTYFEESLISID
ncbi:hypothetical protein QPL79_06960 [Ignisphaera sp. 4213-co]|uniref:ACT domain-containing protein n=1 Tax=Ignisphaera cupida TaxID=3050454 RepID=A0ABD4Z889_9CREN|nr:hypothetical protein [Ignisphaera sp. 4213-co]MDK6029100.1 hypothetical protein [Ignisphaera sp. 4213-co]